MLAAAKVVSDEPSSIFTTLLVVSYNSVPCFLVRPVRLVAVFFGRVSRRVLLAVPPSKSLLVKTSVVALPTTVSDAVKSVTVPVFVKLPAVAPVKVLVDDARFLFVSVSDKASVASVDVLVGKVIVEEPEPVKLVAVAPVNVFVAEAMFLLVWVSAKANVANVDVDVGNVIVDAPEPVNDVAVAPVKVFVLLAKFLLVRVSVVALPTTVSEAVNSVTVPVLVKLAAVAPVRVFVLPRVLLVNVSDSASVANVEVVPGNVIVEAPGPVKLAEVAPVMTLATPIVLFVKVSDRASVARFEVLVGNVMVDDPEPVKVVAVAPVRVLVTPIVLLVNVSLPASVASVPVVGNVTFVLPVVVSVNEFAPDVTKAAASVKFPPRLIVRFASLTLKVSVRLAVRVDVDATFKSYTEFESSIRRGAFPSAMICH